MFFLEGDMLVAKEGYLEALHIYIIATTTSLCRFSFEFFFLTNLLLSNDVSGTTATVVAVTVNGEFRLLENTPRGFFLFWVKSVILIPF